MTDRMIVRYVLTTGLVLATLIGCGSDPATHTAKDTAGTTATEPMPLVPIEPAPPADVATDVVEVEPRAWAHESSDVPVDPRIRFGSFANGMRWAWADNGEPKDRCYLRLHVDVGSMAETDSELGMAHFLEHMAFNGSANFPPGTLIVWFQKHGMSFGADTNAHTSFGETVYKLDLPKSDRESILDGLTVMRDFADGMTIADRDVQGEKGVIDGEQRERDSAGFRVMKKQLEVMFAGTRLKDRLPIGTKEVRDTFTQESVRAFYERWYRPDNMTLVAVGDFGDLDPVELFREKFADMQTPATPRLEEPAKGSATKFDHVFSIYEHEIPSVEISIGRLKPWTFEPVTKANMVKDLPLSYARRMLNLRFSELAKQPSAPFVSASASGAQMLEVFDGEALTINATPENWKAALAAGEQELRRALEHGFQQSELDEVRTNALRGLDEAVEREATQSSRAILNRILSAAENPTVPIDASTRRTIVKPAVEALTVDACLAALRKAWSEGELSISTTGNLDLGADAAEQLRAAYAASRSVEVAPPEAKSTEAFAYGSDDATPGKIAERRHVEDLDFEMVRFENGVALNVKKTDFQEKQILVNVSFGEGELTADPAQLAALSFVGPAVMNGGGLAAHSNDDLRRLLAGKQVGVGFGVGSDRFSLGGATTAEDLKLELELAAAHLTAPGWREESLTQLRRQVPMLFAGLQFQHSGPVQKEFLPALHGGDPRFGLPEQETLLSLGPDDVKAWLEPVLADAPIEITLVGDLDVDAAIDLVARTFGTLPKRRAWKDWAAHRKAPAVKSGVSQTHEITTQVPKSLVIVAYPTNDGIDMARRRSFNMLNGVVRDRLRVEVRERLGAAYSPGSVAQSDPARPGVGMLMMQAMADPEKVEELVDAFLAVGDSLATDGVTQEEVDRLREPILKGRRDGLRTNGFWMTILSRAQSDPAHLPAMRAADDFYANFGPKDLTPLAQQYLGRDKASILIVNPAQ